MKTTKDKGKAASGPVAPKAPRYSVDNTDLNVDSNRTNAYRGEVWDIKESDITTSRDESVEVGQDREVVRKMEDANPDDLMK